MHCYRCGNALKEGERHLRRRVQTGGWINKSYPAARFKEARTSFGMRVVCRRCARLIDLSERRLEVAENAKLAVALCLLAALVIWSLLTR